MKSTLLSFSGKVASSSSGLSDDRATMTRCVDEESSSTTELRRRWLRRRRGSEEECLRPWNKWLKMLTAERLRGEGCMATRPQFRPAPLPGALWAQGKLLSAEVAGAERSGASPSALGSWCPGLSCRHGNGGCRRCCQPAPGCSFPQGLRLLGTNCSTAWWK